MGPFHFLTFCLFLIYTKQAKSVKEIGTMRWNVNRKMPLMESLSICTIIPFGNLNFCSLNSREEFGVKNSKNSQLLHVQILASSEADRN